MDDDLERERVSLMARLVALERQHDALRDEPADSQVRALHFQDLLRHQADVRRYLERVRTRTGLAQRRSIKT